MRFNIESQNRLAESVPFQEIKILSVMKIIGMKTDGSQEVGLRSHCSIVVLQFESFRI